MCSPCVWDLQGLCFSVLWKLIDDTFFQAKPQTPKVSFTNRFDAASPCTGVSCQKPIA